MSFRRSGLILSAPSLFLAFLLPGSMVEAARPVTVGDFSVRLARSLGFPVFTPAEAHERLDGIGLAMGSDFQSPLSEARAVKFALGLGIAAGTSGDPSAVLSQPRADLLARVVTESVLSSPAPPGLNGSLPTSCMFLGQGQCFNCCVASLLGYAAIPQRVVSICNSSCTAIATQTGASPSSP